MAEKDPNYPAASQILYPLEAKPPIHTAALVGLQHVLAMFVGVIAPPLILAGIVGYSKEESAYLLSMGLIGSAIGTIIQIKRRGPFGSGMLCVTGTSFAFIPILAETGKAGGIPLMIGMSLAAAPMQMLFAPILPRLRNFFSPIVTGTFLILIGFSLVPAAFTYIIRGFGTEAPVWAPHLMAGITIVIVIICNGLGRPFLRLTSIVLSLGIGYATCAIFGWVQAPPPSTGWVIIPVPFHFGLEFNWAYLLPFALMYVFSGVETVGDLTATSEFSGEPTTGNVFWNRIQGGVLADGLNSVIAGILNSFPNTSFSQNNGVIQLTGVASRRIGYYVSGFMLILGIFPPIGRWISITPPPVLGGLTLILFSFILVAGIRVTTARHPLDQRSVLVLAVALGTGVGLQMKPEILDVFPDWVRLVFGTPFVTGGLVALILNGLLPNRIKEKA
ncbi:uracil-xanthine permease family protein [Pelagicoccus albus]|uniref:Purine permease n=1 Tax=Pelagicoccus albus TaxID=415222 RepID=A0A7X1B998_9BACT|nr:nucleobase:cation symporter-2 family protein [Pelagicoccus albus]MBC2607907.1 purine permease [Pelagicoccus albus]